MIALLLSIATLFSTADALDALAVEVEDRSPVTAYALRITAEQLRHGR